MRVSCAVPVPSGEGPGLARGGLRQGSVGDLEREPTAADDEISWRAGGAWVDSRLLQ